MRVWLWVRKIPGVGNGSILQDRCLGNAMDWEAWWAAILVAAESQTGLETQHLHTHYGAGCAHLEGDGVCRRRVELGTQGWRRGNIYIYILFLIIFPFRFLHNIEQSPLCCAVGPCWLSKYLRNYLSWVIGAHPLICLSVHVIYE